MSETVECESYANEVQRFYYETLKWCGCGNPDDALAFMRDVLQVMHDRSEANRSDPPFLPYEQTGWAKHTAKLDEMLPGTLGLSYHYMLDALELTEHGSSIGGQWLTDEGERVRQMLADAGDLEAAMDDDNYPVKE